MPDNKATLVTPKEEGCASWDAQMVDSAEIIKNIKRNNNFRHQSPEPDSSNPVELPQPIFREVPVHVTRAPNRSVQAIPPPSAQPQALPSRPKNEGCRRPKRLGGNGDDDGSESDSGGDGRRNGRHSPDGPLQKRKPPPPEVEPPSHDPRSLKGKHVAQKAIVLSPEEEERVQNLKRLNAFEKTFGDRLDLRSLNRAVSKDKRNAFLKGKTTTPHDSAVLDDVEQKQAALNEYLDESFYSAVVDDRLSSELDKTERQSVITDLIAETESKVTEIIKSVLPLRLHNFEDMGSWPGTAIPLARVLSNSSPGHIQFPYALKGCHKSEVSIGSILLQRQRAGKDPLVDTYLDLIMDGTPDGNFGGLPITDILFHSGRSSCKPYQLSPEYVESLRSRVGAVTFDTLVSRRFLHFAGNPLEEFKKRMKTMHMEPSQKFFQFGTEVDLALFKGFRPSIIQRVLPEDLQKIGWRLDGKFGRDQQGAERYWRYATFDDHPGAIFAVDMKGDVLGVPDLS